jgi:hypothetical protein
LVFAGQAQAATLPFTGRLTTVIGTLPPLQATGSGTATISGTSLTSLSLPGGSFPLTLLSLPVTDPAAAPVIGILAKNVNNGAGSFSGGPPSNGKMALKGRTIVCLLGSGVGCSSTHSANLTVPFTLNGTRGVGLGGAPIIVPPKAGIRVTVNGHPWTAGTAAVNTGMGNVTVMGFLHGPASGGAATAGQASGVVELVTPTLISTNIGASATIPAFAVLNIHFTAVPEPGTLLLLSSGVVGLVVFGRRRMTK